MGKESTLKTLRKQLRTVVRENIKEVLSAELVATIQKDLRAKLDGGIQSLNSFLVQRLEQIEGRVKDVQKTTIDHLAKKDASPAQALLVDMENKS